MSFEKIEKLATIMGSTSNYDTTLRVLSYASVLLSSKYAPGSKEFQGLLDFNSKIGDARFINRFYGTIHMYQWLKAAKTPNDKVKALSMFLMHPLDNAFWISTLEGNPLNIPTIPCLLWISRLWFIYIVTDFKKNVETSFSGEKRTDAQKLYTKLRMVTNICDSMIALQYVTINPLFPVKAVQYAGLIGGLCELYAKMLL
eukprot:maker-scaffold_78-snap-gene-0.2-mRNA-1 protein AED:0.00 eAED:0.00 QI:120/1/1/1/1/1/2/132/199